MKNLFTVADSALLLIDHQRGTIKLAVSTPHDEIARNMRALARKRGGGWEKDRVALPRGLEPLFSP